MPFYASGTLGKQNPNALIQRACTVTVGFPGSNQGIQIVCGNGTGLDVSFTIRRSLHITQGSVKPQPGTCDLRLYGLSPPHRKALAMATGRPPTAAANTPPGTAPPAPLTVPCVIEAGYQQRQTVLYSGELRTCQDVSEGPNVITEVSTGDGDQALSLARLNIAIPPGATIAQALNQVIAALGVQIGNLTTALASMQSSPAGQQIFSKGATLKGSASEIMTDICRSVGVQWSIQNGAISVVELGQPLAGTATVISEATGMLGVPTVDTKGIVSVQTLMIPGLVPGSMISIPSINATGGFRIIEMETTGDTSIGSSSWGHSISAQVY